MGNSPSSSSDEHKLNRNTSSASNAGAKFTLVYQETPAIVYRPDKFDEALDQARHTFQIPRFQPLKLSYKYLSVGFVNLTEHNWNAVIPTIHTIFITSEPVPVPSPVPSPGIPDSRRLSPAPFTESQTSHPSSLHSQSTERSNILPVSPMDPRSRTPHTPPYPTPEAEGAPVTETANLSPTGANPNRPSRLELPLPQLPAMPPIRSPLGKKPLPTPPQGRTSISIRSPRPISFVPPPIIAPHVPATFTPPPLSPSGDPSKISFFIYHADASSLRNVPQYHVLHLPRMHTITDLKDVLSDQFIMPTYLQDLWIDGRLLGEESESRMLEPAGIVEGKVVVLSRAGQGTTE